MRQQERREAILQTAVPLFAEKGFHGVKTREIANAAGVSEALVFQHFESKEALFKAIQAHAHGAGEDSELVARFLSLPPSTEKLMVGLHMMLTHLAEEAPGGEKGMPRLLLQSLLGDGELARSHLSRFERDASAPCEGPPSVFPCWRKSWVASPCSPWTSIRAASRCNTGAS